VFTENIKYFLQNGPLFLSRERSFRETCEKEDDEMLLSYMFLFFFCKELMLCFESEVPYFFLDSFSLTVPYKFLIFSIFNLEGFLHIFD